MGSVLTLGDRVVVRAACWPTAALADFAAPDFAPPAGRHALHVPATFAHYEASYATRLREQRRRLWARTREDAGFMRALALVNPGFCRAVAALHFEETPSKSTRHAETTLYRYLARAVGRTEPNGVWSGTALARWGERTRVVSRPARWAFAPELAPLQSLAEARLSREPYRRSGHWRLNETLAPDAEGGWTYLARGPRGLSRRRVRLAPEVGEALGALRGSGPATWDALLSLLASRTPAGTDVAALAEAFARGGLLLGGPRFPTRFVSAWDALRKVAARLSGPDARAWRRCVNRLGRLCRRLETRFEALEAPAVLAAHESARHCVRTLAAALGEPPPELPRAMLRCDLELPFELELGPEVKAALGDSLEHHLGWMEDSGLLGRAHAATRAWLLPAGEGAPWAALRPPPPLLPAPGPEARERRGLPLGLFFARLTPEAVAARGVFELGAHTSRFWHLWRQRDGGRLDPLHAWLAAQYQRLSDAHGVDWAELAQDFGRSPNTLARPHLTPHVVDVWGCERRRVPLALARFEPTPAGAPLLRVPGRERPLAVRFSSAAHATGDDPLTESLLLTSFRLPPGLVDAKPLPRPGPSGAPGARAGVVARWELKGEALTELRVRHRARRYAAWLALAARHGLPEWLWLSRDGQPPVLVPRDSPLGIECFFEGFDPERHTLTLEEAADDRWLVDERGHGFRAELGVPFVREPHAWSA
ncbi:hypothetical protein HMI51_34365 [Corallococcus coralloides]|nr:hypothetical protein [Corallococcus coralloides]